MKSATLTVAMLVLAALPARGQEMTGQQILEATDKAVVGFDDQEMDVTLTVKDRSGEEKEYTINIKQKGDDKRLIRFTSGEDKGMSVLTENQDRMYVYMPGYKKVRPVAAHNMNQGFIGSDFTNADMANAAWAKLYSATLLKDDDKIWYIELTPKAGKETAYPKVILHVGKKEYRQWGTDYFNSKGEKVKEMRASQPKVFDGVMWPSRVVMSDPSTGHSTTLVVRSLKINQGLKKSIFTKRHLQWSK